VCVRVCVCACVCVCMRVCMGVISLYIHSPASVPTEITVAASLPGTPSGLSLIASSSNCSSVYTSAVQWLPPLDPLSIGVWPFAGAIPRYDLQLVQLPASLTCSCPAVVHAWLGQILTTKITLARAWVNVSAHPCTTVGAPVSAAALASRNTSDGSLALVRFVCPTVGVGAARVSTGVSALLDPLFDGSLVSATTAGFMTPVVVMVNATRLAYVGNIACSGC
jgi:hypothetical protein